MRKRSPTTDPLPGDVLTKGTPKGTLERRVLSVSNGRVGFSARNKTYFTSLYLWRAWAVDAKIAKTAMNTT